MNLPIERARARRPVTWLTLIGVLLLPVVIGGVLVAALYNPAERLDAMSAAIVNEDDPVTIDGQTVPLGRQLTAGLVEGSDEVESNLSWTISNADDAADGLADGTYAAVVTIPSNFSAAATSTQPGETPERATIEVATPPDSLIVDDAITAQVTQAAASLMGQELSSIYLENVFLGFTTLGDELGAAADGARDLADGAGEAASGARSLADGFPQLASGADGLQTGAGQLQSGLGTIADKTREAASGASQLAAGVNQGAADLEANGIVPQQLIDYAAASRSGAADAAAALGGAAQSLAPAAQTLGALAQQCDPAVSGAAFCADLATAAATVGGAAASAGSAAAAAVTTATNAAATSIGLETFADQAPGELATQFRAIGSNVAGLAGGLSQLAGGIDQSASGAGQLASGAGQLAEGTRQAGDGAASLADGIAQLSGGTAQLADGLVTASDSLPSYTDSEATSLADVVAAPVEAEGVGSSLFGASALPLLATLALWFGGLGTFVALQAVTRRTLTSRAPSALLALRTLAPAAGLGALQGLLVAGVVQLAASYDLAEWSIFAGICVAAGVAFAAVNQALVAVFGGAGRWIAALVGVLAVATGIVSTVPGVLSSVAGLLPTAPAYNAMLGALTEAAGVGAGLAGLAIWSLLAFAATLLAVSRRRSVSAKALLAATPA